MSVSVEEGLALGLVKEEKLGWGRQRQRSVDKGPKKGKLVLDFVYLLGNCTGKQS